MRKIKWSARKIVTNFFARLRSHSFEDYIYEYFPRIHKLLVRVGLHRISRRIKIFRNTASDLNKLFWIYFLIFGKHVSRKGFSLSNYGVWLAHKPNDSTYKFCLEASYMNNLDRILKNISQKTVFIDIGANIGVFSLIASSNQNIISIHSFEPDANTFHYLKLNASRNQAFRITLHNLAIGRESGTTRLSKINGHSGASRIISDENQNVQQFSSIEMVNETYLNSIFDLKLDQYFVKIDVEGYELEVLKTLERSDFFQFTRGFFIEFDEDFGKVNEVEEFLTSHGFSESGRWGNNFHWDALWEREVSN